MLLDDFRSCLGQSRLRQTQDDACSFRGWCVEVLFGICSLNYTASHGRFACSPVLTKSGILITRAASLHVQQGNVKACSDMEGSIPDGIMGRESINHSQHLGLPLCQPAGSERV